MSRSSDLESPDRARVLFVVILAAFALGIALRVSWLTADPPVTGVGIVWHDEGAWVHNARNRVLWDQWRTDAWNPVFLAPVFTGLEYVAFELLGVGTWQARTVPVASGLVAMVFLVLGVRAVAGSRAAAAGACLVATNFAFVMWNRAALMESTMTSFIVVGWAAYALAQRRPWWGALAGAAAVLACLTKAAAAFFVAALVLEALTGLLLARRAGAADGARRTAAAGWTLAGVGAAGVITIVFFLAPYWTEVRFYNWQMSVTRKPSYAFADMVDRATWLPIVHDIFTRMWLVVVLAAAGAVSIAARWRAAHPAERLLLLWVLLGLAELVVHDAGNARRYVMFVPAMIALAVVPAGAGLMSVAGDERWRRWVAAAMVGIFGYLAFGSGMRVALLDDASLNPYRTIVRLSGGLALILAATVWWRWRALAPTLTGWRLSSAALAIATTISCAVDLGQYWQWARHRTSRNHDAALAVGRLLPAGTLVHGKLANGLSLENLIRPVFVGDHFGNYSDRLSRPDVRYILSYVAPWPGYEGDVILEVLDRYPLKSVVALFEVEETPALDQAALFDKFPGGVTRARD